MHFTKEQLEELKAFSLSEDLRKTIENIKPYYAYLNYEESVQDDVEMQIENLGEELTQEQIDEVAQRVIKYCDDNDYQEFIAYTIDCVKRGVDY